MSSMTGKGYVVCGILSLLYSSIGNKSYFRLVYLLFCLRVYCRLCFYIVLYYTCDDFRKQGKLPYFTAPPKDETDDVDELEDKESDEVGEKALLELKDDELKTLGADDEEEEEEEEGEEETYFEDDEDEEVR